MIHPAILVGLSYLIGSIPAAYLAGKLTRGIDLREHGSGNLGATNVYRVLGPKIALVVLLVDALKGALPVLLFPGITAAPRPDLWAIAYAVAAIAGHVRSIFLLWRGGGKGVATAAGAFMALAPLPSLVALAVFVTVLFARGYVSLGSLTAATVLPVMIAFRDGVRSPLFVVSAVVAAFVFWTHRANIGRLRSGEEPRFGKKSPE
ncbi:MAG TPA: glycerol-3-phosphate 1-O-acyltransferase PlsY [Gemmatimonadaceae bacterium]|nr:glycerol-3-phosphate 1-O-acyltransferase PlsY [Gemmatimonadaceae bacterium]